MLILCKNLLLIVGSQRPKAGKIWYLTLYQATNAKSKSFWFKSEDGLHLSYVLMIGIVCFTDDPPFLLLKFLSFLMVKKDPRGPTPAGAVSPRWTGLSAAAVGVCSASSRDC